MTAVAKSVCIDCGQATNNDDLCDKCNHTAQIAAFPPFASVLLIALTPVVLIAPVIFFVLTP